MNLINCLKCGVVLDKDVLIENLKNLNNKVEYSQRTNFIDYPCCNKWSFDLFEDL